MLPCDTMRRVLLVPVLTAAVIACSDRPETPDHQAEWRDVLKQKQAAAAQPTPGARQAYADSLAAFVRRHPNHGRAREVYHRIQLEFANDLSALGRHQDAVRFYRSVLNHDPTNAEAQKGLDLTLSRLAVSRDKLLALEKGMTTREVAQLLGKPVPGWTMKTRRRGAVNEAWYYRTTSGGLAGVYFRDGKVFAAEENSHARIGL